MLVVPMDLSVSRTALWIHDDYVLEKMAYLEELKTKERI
jgi:hypothetical protein